MMWIEDLAGAVEAYQRACELDETQSRCAIYAIALQRVGRESEARAAAEAAETMGGHPNHYDMACYYALAGDRDRAIQRLRHELDRGYNSYNSDWIARDPDLESLHGDPEFEAIVAEVKKRIGEE